MFRVSSRTNRFRYVGIDLAADAVAANSEYDTSRSLAGLVWGDPHDSFDGLSYTARHDNSQLMTSIAVFGEPGVHSPTDTFADVKTGEIPESLVARMVESFRFEVPPDVPLP